MSTQSDESLKRSNWITDSTVKRCFDVVASLFGLIALFPILILVATLVKITSSGPILFRQQRVGRHRKHFELFKFRTMINGTEALGRETSGTNDPRITQIGAWLRKTKLDEIPQLINVFIGDMSFVGPRPEIPFYAENYGKEDQIVLQLRPGITDLATLEMADLDSIMQTRGEMTPAEFYLCTVQPRKLKLQREYVLNRSFFGDILIIIRTLLKIWK
jgi:lipopolysaccharide/colanic/teichoic acid biosynthesis glycosyltransferase